MQQIILPVKTTVVSASSLKFHCADWVVTLVSPWRNTVREDNGKMHRLEILIREILV